ncbi:histidine kinase [Paenibacillus albicereus]|uniref:Histidine kinase n=1 Tax=Paenibacillus albicereus TaxID=2726185 RepID=A0A6H2H283_9BACL|nr:sensor histidine kinase [Paenibacillus albicereus]QJC53526.1 histidine kinase [Paenibacillus albicereus]
MSALTGAIGRVLRLHQVNRQILALALLLVTLPLVAMAGTVYYAALQAAKHEYQNSSGLLLNNLRFNIDQYLQSIEKGTYSAQLDAQLQGALEQSAAHPEEDRSLLYRPVIEQFISTIEMTIKNVDSVQIYAGQRIFYSADFNRSSYSDTDVSGEEWHRRTLAAKGAPVIFGTHRPFLRTDTTAEVISIARVINKTGTKTPLGLILVDIRLDSLREILSLSENSDRRFLIVDGEGGFVYASDGAAGRQGSGMEAVDLDRVLGQASGDFYAPVSGRDSYLNFVTSPYSGWKVIQSIEEYRMTQDAKQLRLLLLGFAFATAGAALLFHYLLSERVTKPIIVLSRHVRAVGVGKLPTDLRSDRKDELGVLYNGIRRMAEDLQAQVEHSSTMLARQKMAQYGALKSQINPHFLANALESIQMQAIVARQRGIAETIGMLGRLFRLHIQTGKEIVPLREELQHIRLYVQIQQMRFGGRIAYTERLAPGAEDAAVLHFSLQPLIENAFIHGLEPLSRAGWRSRRPSETERCVSSSATTEPAWSRRSWPGRGSGSSGRRSRSAWSISGCPTSRTGSGTISATATAWRSRALRARARP